ncbi:SRPBCC family protein [Candidatus Omnitrophota bacterium]
MTTSICRKEFRRLKIQSRECSMRDKDLIEIEISRLIPAQKWRVIRLITKVADFPKYISCVKEASVIQKSRHSMKTKWRVEIENIPISWTEEDTLEFDRDTIHFKSVEGDLQEFSGKWKFQTVKQGTRVTVNAYLKVGIPIIKDFADVYMKKLLTRNFTAILDAVERRLISVRYTSFKGGDKQKVAGFGIIGHPYNFNHLGRCLKELNPDFNLPSREFLGQIFNTTPSFKLYDILNFKSKTGQLANGCFILATFIPDMLGSDMWAVFSKVVRACKVAEKNGVGIVALSGFASIVAERIGSEISDQVDVPVTTGNAFTAATALDGIFKAAAVLNLELSSAKVAIIGGAGDVGSACARVLVEKVKELNLTDCEKANLNNLKNELSKNRKAKIVIATEAGNETAVRDADIVIATASVTESVLKIEWFKPGSIVCDIGYPKNIPYTESRKDILIFSGGLVKSPTPISFPMDIGLPSPEIIYASFAEGIILDLEKDFENFSFGKGGITPEKIEQIRQLGAKHGFQTSDFYWGNEKTPLENIRELVNVSEKNK